MPRYDITIEVTVDATGLDVSALPALAERVLTGEDVADGTGVSILVTDDDEVRSLNRQFLGIDEATDVLSFPDEGAEPFPDGGEPPYLGDIAIALPTAIRQAAELGHSLDAEVAHLLVHGLLHLTGYDHVESEKAEAEMRAREESYLGPGAHGDGPSA
jgi:probable rRNA maturation factor